MTVFVYNDVQKEAIMTDPRGPPFGNRNVITRHMMSSLLVGDLKGNILDVLYILQVSVS